MIKHPHYVFTPVDEPPATGGTKFSLIFALIGLLLLLCMLAPNRSDAQTVWAQGDSHTNYPQGATYTTLGTTFTATGDTLPIKAVNAQVVLQVDGGSCSGFSGQLQRTAVDPAGIAPLNNGQTVTTPTVAYVAVGSAQSSVATAYVQAQEYSVGFWRYHVTAVTGSCNVSLSTAQK